MSQFSISGLICVTLAISALLSIGPALAINCPPPPSQVTSDTRLKIEGEVGSLMRLAEGTGKVEFEEKAVEIYSKYPNSGRLVIMNLMISTVCELLKDSNDLDDGEKVDKLLEVAERLQRAATPGEEDQFPPEAQVSFLQSAFASKDREAVRIALGRALDNSSLFIQNLALKALFGGIKSTYSGELFFREKPTPFILKVTKFDDFDGTLEGVFVGWDEKFVGQLSSTTLAVVGNRYSFSIELKEGEIMEGTAWEGCMMGSPKSGCTGFEGMRLRLF